MELPSISILFISILVVHSSALVQSPPKFVKQPPAGELLFQVVHNGDGNDKPFFIECEAEGVPAPNYRWIKNGKPFAWQAYDDRIDQQPGRGTLIFTSPRDEDLGHYQCFAQNELGVATSNSVFVREAVMNSFKKDQGLIILSANEGDPSRLPCTPPDGWPKPSVIWLIQTNDGGIKRINSSRITTDPEGSLWFSYVTLEDMSEDSVYVCAATSKVLNKYELGTRVRLDVVASGIPPSDNRHEPVQQYVSRRNEIAIRGKKVEIYCIFGGTPLPQIAWRKDGLPVQWSDQIAQGNYGKSLIIKNAQFEDEGAYTCEVSNGVGQAKSYSVNLQVLVSPYFTQEPEAIIAIPGETVEFKCEASGVPEPMINWIHNGKPIGESPPNPRRKVTSNKIIIKQLDNTDTGNYGCNATNSLGYVYKDFYVNVLAEMGTILDSSI